MREATKEERDGIKRFIESISTPTGNNIFEKKRNKMKIMTDKQIKELIYKEYNRGYQDGRFNALCSRDNKEEINNAFHHGMKAIIEDIKSMFERASTPEEFCDIVYEFFLKGK